MKTKRILSFILAVLILLSFTHLAAFAATDEASDLIADGYVRTQANYKSTYGSTEKITCAYDNSGNLLKKTDVYKYGTNSRKTVTSYRYDKKGNLIKDTQKREDTVIVNDYTYNQNGQISKEVETFDFDGMVSVTTTIYTYDKNGNCIRKSVNCTGASTYQTDEICTYDRKGRLVKTFLDGSFDGLVPTTTTYAYGKNGLLSKKVQVQENYDGRIDRIMWSYSYNSNGQLKKLVTRETGYYDTKTATSYYYKDNLLKKKVTSRKNLEDGSTETITEAYAYDAAGNLTKETRNSSVDGRTVWTYKYQKIGA